MMTPSPAGPGTAHPADLMCQLSAAVQPFDCRKGLETVQSYLQERGAGIPPECGLNSGLEKAPQKVKEDSALGRSQ